MTKKEIIKEIRNVMTGKDGGFIKVWKEGRSWKSNWSTSKSQIELDEVQFSHCCNSMSLKEAKEELEEAINRG